jgi:hypothetical protein
MKIKRLSGEIRAEEKGEIKRERRRVRKIVMVARREKIVVGAGIG